MARSREPDPMLNMRQLARSVFRFAAHLEPGANESSRPLGRFDPRHLARAGLLTARFGSEFIESLWKGPEAAIGYLELDNKVRAFHFFETEMAHLESRPEGLPAAGIRNARERLGHEQAVWASEGIGYEFFERRLRAGRTTRGLFDGPESDVPDGSWTVLHTGMGMALAETWLQGIPAEPSPRLLKERLDEHLQLCRDTARTDFTDLAFEPLGLVTRLLREDLVPRFHEPLDRLGSRWSDLFWHGVGRGLYFLPRNLPPGRSTPWAGLGMGRAEAPTETARRNATSGFAWAATLVNLRHPAVVESFLSHHLQGGDVSDPAAQGIVSALLLWHETTRGSRELRNFVAHVAAPERRALWQSVVRGPFERAARDFGSTSVPADVRRVSELFRYR